MSELNLIEQRPAAVEREVAELKSQSAGQRLGNPWTRMQGMLADEPLFDEWRRAIEDYRRQKDDDEVPPR